MSSFFEWISICCVQILETHLLQPLAFDAFQRVLGVFQQFRSPTFVHPRRMKLLDDVWWHQHWICIVERREPAIFNVSYAFEFARNDLRTYKVHFCVEVGWQCLLVCLDDFTISCIMFHVQLYYLLVRCANVLLSLNNKVRWQGTFFAQRDPTHDPQVNDVVKAYPTTHHPSLGQHGYT